MLRIRSRSLGIGLPTCLTGPATITETTESTYGATDPADIIGNYVFRAGTKRTVHHDPSPPRGLLEA